jgi:hypothetical protein
MVQSLVSGSKNAVQRPVPHASREAVALIAAVAALFVLALVLAPRSSAIVPPTDCGTMIVKGKRYVIKADQLRCVTAKSHAKRYLSTHTKPQGYACRDFGAETKLKFRCSRGIKVFFAIRH